MRSNSVKVDIDKMQNCKCRLGGDKEETGGHIIRECSKLEKNKHSSLEWFSDKSYGILRENIQGIKFDKTRSCHKNETHKLLWDWDTNPGQKTWPWLN